VTTMAVNPIEDNSCLSVFACIVVRVTVDWLSTPCHHGEVTAVSRVGMSGRVVAVVSPIGSGVLEVEVEVVLELDDATATVREQNSFRINTRQRMLLLMTPDDWRSWHTLVLGLT